MQNKDICPVCLYRDDIVRQIRLQKHRENKARQKEIRDAIDSGKVIPVWGRDSFSGWHYIDYKGRTEITGPGFYTGSRR